MKCVAAAVLALMVLCPGEGRADSTRRREIVDLTRLDLLRTLAKGYTHSLSPSGHAYAVFDANVVRLIDMRDGREIQALKGHVALIHDSGWSRDGRYIATSGYDSQVRVWEVATGKTLHTFTPHAGYACSVAFSADGKLLATGGSEDGLIKLIDLGTEREARSIPTPDPAIYAMAFTPDGTHLVVNHSLANRADSSVRILRTADGTEVRNVVPGAVSAFALSKDGRTLAYATPRGVIVLLETAGWTELRRLEGHALGISSLAFHPVSRYLASGGRDGAVRIWDVESGRRINSIPIKGETDCRLAFAAEGVALIVASADATVRVYGPRESGSRPSEDRSGPAGPPGSGGPGK